MSGRSCVVFRSRFRSWHLTAGLVRVVLGPPVLFRQTRPGLNGKPFQLLKFRTMTDARDADGTPLADGQRLSAYAAIPPKHEPRRIAELINVMRGEMSMVGPSPC